MEILLTLTVGTLCIVCFFIGVRVGQAVSRGETIKTPPINPLETIRRREDRKKAETEQDRIETIMGNIERYDGTSNGQRDVPGG